MVTIGAKLSVTLVGVVVALVMERDCVHVGRRVSLCITIGLFKVLEMLTLAEHVLACTEEVPTCGDTCDKVGIS